MWVSIGADLPFSKHVHSKLVCAITRQRMDEHNPPLVTPKGYCYSEAGMQQVRTPHKELFKSHIICLALSFSD